MNHRWRMGHWLNRPEAIVQARDRSDGDVDVREYELDEFGRRRWSSAQVVSAGFWIRFGCSDPSCEYIPPRRQRPRGRWANRTHARWKNGRPPWRRHA